MKVKHDVSWRASWEVAGRMCPALFSKGDKNAFRRWRAADAEPTESTDMGGRKSHIGLAQRQELQVMVHSLVARGIPVSLVVLHALFRKKLAPLPVSRSWVYYFLRDLGLSSRSTKTVSSKRRFTEEQKSELQRLLRLKVAWLQREFSVPDWCIYNLDETCVQLVPRPHRCWTFSGKKAESVAEDSYSKLSVTVTLAMPPPVAEDDSEGISPCFGQVIFAGKTSRVLPPKPWPVDVICEATPSHWASQDTFLAFLSHIQDELGEQQHWLALVDCAPIHIAQELRDHVSLLLPYCHLCYIQAGATSILQPLDVGCFKAFKNHISQQWASTFAAEVLAGTDKIGRVTKTPALRADMLPLVSEGMLYVNKPARKSSWKHILVPAAEKAAVLKEADALHALGGLFGSS